MLSAPVDSLHYKVLLHLREGSEWRKLLQKWHHALRNGHSVLYMEDVFH